MLKGPQSRAPMYSWCGGKTDPVGNFDAGIFPSRENFFSHMPTLAVSHIPLTVQYWVEVFPTFDLQRVWNNLNIVILVSLQEMNCNNVSKHNDGNY